MSQIDQAQHILSEGRYAEAFPLFLNLAQEQQNPLAQFNVGLFYHQGWGRKQDIKKACEWFEKAAYNDIPTAYFFMGECLTVDSHRKANIEEAISWYQKAAQVNQIHALCKIADLYITGIGIQQDIDKGLAYCREAVLSNNIKALLSMGRYFYDNPFIPRNLSEASIWFEKAAQQGAPEAAFFLGKINLEPTGEIELARYWFEHAAARGYIPAYIETAKLYYVDAETVISKKLSAEHLAKAYLWYSATFQSTRDSSEK